MQSRFAKNMLKKCKYCQKYDEFDDIKTRKMVSFLPNTDKIILNILDENTGIDLIYKVIDDLTEYLLCEIGYETSQFSILYDDNNNIPDRYLQFF